MSKKVNVDWDSARVLYVNDSTLTYREIAERFGCRESTARARASRERWPEARVERSELLLTHATENSIRRSAWELSEYNATDLATAKTIRAEIIKKLDAAGEDTLSAKEIRSLAGALESAQRTARNALGTSTGNHLPAIASFAEDDDLDLSALSDEELAAFRQLIAKGMRRGGETIQ